MAALFWFTVRQMFLQRKIWLTAGLLAFPAAVVLLVRNFAGQMTADDVYESYHGPMQFLVFMLIMPLVCMLYGTALIGAELEQRTLVYLTTRRLRRATVLLVRFAATWVALTLMFQLGMLALHVCTVGGVDLTTDVSAADNPNPGQRSFPAGAWQPWHDLGCYLAVAPAGVAGFVAMFTALSLLTRRSLMLSIVYFIMFELTLGNLPLSARRFTITHQLRQMMVSTMPDIRRFYGLPAELAERLHPAGATGTWTLIGVVVVLLSIASILMTFRELVPTKVGRE